MGFEKNPVTSDLNNGARIQREKPKTISCCELYWSFNHILSQQKRIKPEHTLKTRHLLFELLFLNN